MRSILTPAIIAFLIIAFTSHFAMGAFDVVWSLWLRHLGASMAFIGLTWIAFSSGAFLPVKGQRGASGGFSEGIDGVLRTVGRRPSSVRRPPPLHSVAMSWCRSTSETARTASARAGRTAAGGGASWPGSTRGRWWKGPPRHYRPAAR